MCYSQFREKSHQANVYFSIVVVGFFFPVFLQNCSPAKHNSIHAQTNCFMFVCIYWNANVCLFYICFFFRSSSFTHAEDILLSMQLSQNPFFIAHGFISWYYFHRAHSISFINECRRGERKNRKQSKKKNYIYRTNCTPFFIFSFCYTLSTSVPIVLCHETEFNLKLSYLM